MVNDRIREEYTSNKYLNVLSVSLERVNFVLYLTFSRNTRMSIWDHTAILDKNQEALWVSFQLKMAGDLKHGKCDFKDSNLDTYIEMPGKVVSYKHLSFNTYQSVISVKFIAEWITPHLYIASKRKEFLLSLTKLRRN